MSVLIAIFYITLFHHLLENTLAVCRAGKGSVATFLHTLHTRQTLAALQCSKTAQEKFQSRQRDSGSRSEP